MGNSESSSPDSPLLRSGSLGRGRRNHSQSPQRNNGSLRTESESPISLRETITKRHAEPGQPIRRSKTCRAKDNRSASLSAVLTNKQEMNMRKAVCMVTGLTLHQKALLGRKWNRMDRGTVFEIGRLTFVNVFKENPQYLVYLDLKNETNWENHINFKIHVQRFVIALIECMRRLKEPSTACDILRDFGAGYATNSKRVSAMYFERLANALNRAAAELQESDHLEIEKTESLMPGNSTNETAISSEWSSEPSEPQSVDSTTSSTPLHPVRSEAQLPSSGRISSCTMTSRGSDSRISTMKKTLKRIDSCETHDHGHEKSLCPITAEAWIVLSAFLANQIKLGYEVERMIKNEMSKLGLDTLIAPSAVSAVLEQGVKRPVHA